ncbi:cation:proton antiporter [Kocuria sp.]|uniref:cation:proton antiporter n=1 Tax=Kocuria sp. TaxID=1871328 RepID=UPI003F8D6B2C
MACAVISERTKIPSALLLVSAGTVIGFLPWLPAIHVDPEIVLAGILPPLLYAAAVSMPTMNFRREFRSISRLSVMLVVASSLALGYFFAAVIPGLELPWAIALGAIVSPTDAVATGIAKRLGVSPRVISILDGEGLLNDATSLVILRTAVAAVAASFSFWGAMGAFAWAVLIAGVVGWCVGWLYLKIRSRLNSPTVGTVLSLAVPFVASVPVELLEGSGLVAAVVAGLVVSSRAPRELPPEHRLTDSRNWATVELVLESAIFLVMGLQMYGVFQVVHEQHSGVWIAVKAAGWGLLLVLAVRLVYVTLLLRRTARRHRRWRKRWQTMDEFFQDREAMEERFAHRKIDDPEKFWARIRRRRADMDYYDAEPLGWREGSVLVWAGMRGAVTVAAVQTLPLDAPGRPVLVLVAFLIATASLFLQGSTLAVVVRLVKPAMAPDTTEERQELRQALHQATGRAAISPEDIEQRREQMMARSQEFLSSVRAQREALLTLRDEGTFSAEVLVEQLEALDAAELYVTLQTSS